MTQKSYFLWHLYAGIIVFLWKTPIGISDPMLGDAGAAWSTADATLVNPANGAFLDRTQVTGVFELLRNETLFIRYPGGQPVVNSNSGLGSLAGATPPVGVVKISPRFSLGGFAIPPGLGANIDINKIPILILGQTNFVDIKAKGTAEALGGFSTSYRMNEKISLGIGANMRSISFTAILSPSDGGPALATIKGKISDVLGQVGFRFELLPGRVGVGVGIAAFQIHEETIDLESPLFPTEAAREATPTGTSQTVPFSQMTAGFYAQVARLKFLGDIRYTRAIQGTQAFSIVELKPKTRDVYDTVGISGGGLLQFSERINGVAGFRYEPASVGPGSLSTPTGEGTSGFGTLDLAQIFVGLQSLTPYTQVAVGFQFMALPRSTGKSQRTPGGTTRYYAMTLHGGIGFKEASLGIDKNGEQPAAFYQKKLFIPVGLTIKL